MYAMDTAVHFEHRNESRRSRTESRRSATAPAPAPATMTESEQRAADDFAD